jgi:hypothetical protein
MTPARSSGIQYFISMIRAVLELEIMGLVRLNSSQNALMGSASAAIRWAMSSNIH